MLLQKRFARELLTAYVTKQSGLLELGLAVRKAIRGESYLVPTSIARETFTSLLTNKREPQTQISQRHRPRYCNQAG